MAGASAERQETGVINAINAAVKKNGNNPITVRAGKTTIKGVIGAEKFTGRQTGGSEPYTDVVIKTRIGTRIKEINCSLKGESAPSLAGGGLKGLELAVPGLASRFMKNALTTLKKKIKAGDKVPDVFGQIQEKDKMQIVIGNKAMGGPIDFMYIGKMDVKADYNSTTTTLTMINGALIPAAQYARDNDLYFRLRARREDQRFDPIAKDAAGIPKIYGKSPSRGDSAGRIVVVDKVPSTAVIVKV